MVLRWDPGISLKDVIQIGVLVVGATLVFGRLEAAISINTDTLTALQRAQSKQDTRIIYLEIQDAERQGYERAIRELDPPNG